MYDQRVSPSAYLAALVIGFSFALNTAWLGTKILQGSLAEVLTAYAVSPMTPDLPVQIFVGYTPLFIFVFLFGGIYIQELEAYAVFVFTRSKKPCLFFWRMGMTIFFNLLLYISIYYLGQGLVFVAHGIRQTNLDGIQEMLSAIALQIPLYYTLTMTTNWISLHVGRIRSMLICIGLVLIFTLISFIGYESKSDILFAYSPVSNSFIKWYNIEIMDWKPQYFEIQFSVLYWIATVAFIKLMFYNDYIKTDICFGVEEL